MTALRKKYPNVFSANTHAVQVQGKFNNVNVKDEKIFSNNSV